MEPKQICDVALELARFDKDVAVHWIVSEQRDAIKNIVNVMLELEGELAKYLNRRTSACLGHGYRTPEVLDKLRELQTRLRQDLDLEPAKEERPPSNYVGEEPVAYGAPFDEPFEKG